MIRFSRFSFTYEGAERPTLTAVDAEIGEGELCVVVGETGTGKSTLLRSINGLVPHFTGGVASGDVSVRGLSTASHQPRDLAHLVGYVGQSPADTFVTDLVEDELAYTMENLGIAPMAMRRRVEDTLDLLGLHDLRNRPLRSLSGGQQQRVAIGAVLTASPAALVLDEPTSSLDPAAAEEVLAALARLVHDVGLTVVVAEHRLERVLPFADRVLLVPGDGAPLVDGEPHAVMATSPVAPPLVELGRVAKWSPLPLSVRDARRHAETLRGRLGPAPTPPAAPAAPGDPAAATEGLVVAYGRVRAVDRVTLAFHPGTVTALMGRNGSGKSTFLSTLAGLRRPDAGRARVGGADPQKLTSAARIRAVGFVPQEPSVLLYGDSVSAECAAVDHDAGLSSGTTRAVLERLLPGVADDRHPRDLSEGQRLALAMSVVLAPDPALLLLDEPTRGLDYPGKARLVGMLRGLAGAGHSVVVATHDVELVAQLADRAVVLAGGEVVADGPARDVVCHSPVFAPQVAKVLAPQEWLTVGEVEAALAAEGATW
jgi:energy-coupling factor transport system ATP-binding protein